MRPRWLFALWLIALGMPPAASDELATAASWRRHPAIAESRAIYRATRQAETLEAFHAEPPCPTDK